MSETSNRFWNVLHNSKLESQNDAFITFFLKKASKETYQSKLPRIFFMSNMYKNIKTVFFKVAF